MPNLHRMQGGTVTRLEDWQSNLTDYLLRAERVPFRYGHQDCGLFVAGAIRAMTGVDVASTLRGYTNRTEAFRRIAALCGQTTMEAVAGYIAAAHGIPEVPILLAQRGDAVMLRSGRRSSLGIVAMHGTEILTPLPRRPLASPTLPRHTAPGISDPEFSWLKQSRKSLSERRQ